MIGMGRVEQLLANLLLGRELRDVIEFLDAAKQAGHASSPMTFHVKQETCLTEPVNDVLVDAVRRQPLLNVVKSEQGDVVRR